jgi:hypothetical protein
MAVADADLAKPRATLAAASSSGGLLPNGPEVALATSGLGHLRSRDRPNGRFFRALVGVALCALQARAKGLVTGPVDVSILEALMHDAELIDGQWPLVYEANAKGWLPNKSGTDFAAAHKHFGPMKAAGVSFYDATATLSVTVKPAVADHGDVDDDSDLEYLLGDVSG